MPLAVILSVAKDLALPRVWMTNSMVSRQEQRDNRLSFRQHSGFAPNYRATRAFSAKKADRLSSIIAKLVHFLPKSPINNRPLCHSLLCFHTHSRVDLHF
jgi:hypothetical protein